MTAARLGRGALSRAPLMTALGALLLAGPARGAAEAPTDPLSEAEYTARRHALVDDLRDRDLQDEAVLGALRDVRRHRYVPLSARQWAYENRPLPIGEKQTISQPLIVALMSQLLELSPETRVLEIGTGSGYQAAVLAELCDEVYSIEILEGLGRRAAEVLAEEGYPDIHLRIGDGYLGWPEAAPFDAIIVTCAPDHVPQPLQDQLAEGGRMVIPVGDFPGQKLVLIRKEDGEFVRKDIVAVRFVPMTGAGVESAGGEVPERTDRGEGLN